jgi:hypothetical protein
MRDSTQIEQLAVAKIIKIYSSCKRICPRINMRDNEPLWDGALFLYDSDDHSISTTRGRIPCQVKGKDDTANPDVESYYLTKEELENYLRDGGVLFFLVHIAHPDEPSYWAKLTPVELRHLLKEIEGSQNKGKSITLSRLPELIGTCESETFQFYQHCQLQKAPPIDIAKVAHAGNHFQIIGVPKNSLHPIVALTKGFHYLYNCDEQNNILNVVGDTQFSFEMSKEVDNEIIIGGETFAVPVVLVAAKGLSYLRIGDFITIDLIVQEGFERKLNFSMASVTGVRARSLAFQVLLAMDEEDEFSFPALQASMSCAEIQLKKTKRHEVKSELANSLKVVNLLDRLHITSDIDLNALSTKDLSELNTLYGAIMENKLVDPHLDNENVMTTNVKIGNLTILVWLIKADTGFYVRDFFASCEYEIAIGREDTDDKYPVSRFALLNTADYLRFSNIDWQLIPSDYKALNLHIPEVAHQVNSDALNLLSAYDKSNRQEILEAVLRLTTWLTDAGKDTNEAVIYRINNLQAIKRTRNLSDAEMREITGYADGVNASLELKYCCDLLLDDQIRAKLHFSAMSAEQQAFYKTLPISRFWKQ